MPQTSQKKILAVDDNEIFLMALKAILESKGYQVSPACDAIVAKSLLGLVAIDVVISDIRMPGQSGIELMHHIKKTHPSIPVVLMTGFSEIQETCEAHELGADGFLAKPFKKEDLLQLLDSLLQPAVEPEKEIDLDPEYCKVAIESFISGSDIRFDIFLRISKSKYVKIAHLGENISIDRIRVYKSKQVDFLYLKRDDFRKYVGFASRLTTLASDSDRLDKDKKIALLKHAGAVIMQELHLDGIDEQSFIHTKEIVENSLSLLTESQDAFKLLSQLNTKSDYLFNHSLGVSFFSTMVARQMGWHAATTLFKIAAGGLFHDIGKKEFDQELLDKARNDFTQEELKLYETHPARGAEILSRMKEMSDDVIHIALEHHENCLGMGFPRQLNKAKTHPMARLVAVTNAFCKLVVKNPDSDGVSPEKAIQRMQLISIENYDPACFEALKKVFRIL